MSLGNVIGMLVAGAGADVLSLAVLLNVQAGLYVVAGVLVLTVRPRSAPGGLDPADRAVAQQASG
jgi:hypothetical protein